MTTTVLERRRKNNVCSGFDQLLGKKVLGDGVEKMLGQIEQRLPHTVSAALPLPP